MVFSCSDRKTTIKRHHHNLQCESSAFVYNSSLFLTCLFQKHYSIAAIMSYLQVRGQDCCNPVLLYVLIKKSGSLNNLG